MFRYFRLGLIVFLALAHAALALTRPMTFDELALMVRMGFSEKEIAAEVSSRKLVQPLTDEQGAALADKGASTALLATLRAGNEALDADQAAQFQEQLQQEAVEKQVVNLRWQLRARRAAAAAKPGPGFVQNEFAPRLAGDLVADQDGILQPFDAAAFRAAKYIAFYFSAQWCGPCRQFTPQLVNFYTQFKAKHPDFELIFVSSDRSAYGMKDYMETDHMPWPAVAFDKIAHHPEITRYRGDGIPCLVLVDASGAVVSDSYVKGNYVGPAKVLNDLARISPTP